LKPKKLNYTDSYISVLEYKVPLRVYVERRRTIRIAVGKDNVLLRVPVYEGVNIHKHIASTKDWLAKVAVENPHLLEKYHVDKYMIQKEIAVFGRDVYKIEINTHQNNNDGVISLRDHTFFLSIPEHLDDFDKRIIVRTLISKILAKRYKRFVEERVFYWNERYFKKNVKSITLRYNSTNWGSCSTTTKINFSTRSLLLPLEIFDYIVVHELSHLVEMNHSDKFWAVVRSVMPDYEKAEKWLRDHSGKLDI
jgi:predicted metal-dependent hydrolase